MRPKTTVAAKMKRLETSWNRHALMRKVNVREVRSGYSRATRISHGELAVSNSSVVVAESR